METLNPEQKQVVKHRGSPLVVFAAAGTGKTQALTCRIASLIKDDGVPAEKIVGLTFTRKAANEMKERAAHMAGISPAQLRHVGTFHSFCLQMLRRFGKNRVFQRISGVPHDAERFDVLDPAQVLRRIKHLLVEENMATAIEKHDITFRDQKPDDQAKDVCRKIEKWRNDGYMPDEALSLCVSPLDRAYHVVYARYRESCGEDNCMDFSDLILILTRLLQEDKRLRLYCRCHLFEHLLLDEAQDINDAQMALVEVLCRHHKEDGVDGSDARLVENNLMVVGDDYQAIHAWRGAKVKNLLNFETNFDRVRVVMLGRNYRSLSPILEVADKLIRFNKKQKFKDVVCERNEDVDIDKGVIHVRRVDDAWKQADLVARTIMKQVRSGKHKFSDFAVLYRTHASSQPFEQKMREYNIPYFIKGSISFFERAEIKSALAILRFCVSKNNADLEKILCECIKGVGKKTVASLREKATKVCGSADVFDLKSDGFWRGLVAMESSSRGKKGKVSKAVAGIFEYVGVLRKQVERFESGDGFGEGMSMAKKVWHVFEDMGFFERLEEMQIREKRSKNGDEVDRVGNVNTFLSFIDKNEIEKGCSTIHELFDVLLFDDVEDGGKEKESETDRVVFMTLHSSKGLEWPHVFIVDCVQEVIPFYCGDLEEERRLMYVGVTRARDALYCTYPASRFLFGNVKHTVVSRFLGEMGLLQEKYTDYNFHE